MITEDKSEAFVSGEAFDRTFGKIRQITIYLKQVKTQRQWKAKLSLSEVDCDCLGYFSKQCFVI